MKICWIEVSNCKQPLAELFIQSFHLVNGNYKICDKLTQSSENVPDR